MAWDDILGQDLAKRIFHSHLETGRVFSSYLLVGPEGVGKRRLALEMAKALNCEAPRQQAAERSPERPHTQNLGVGESRDEALRASPQCDACQSCRQIARGVHPDVHLVVPGGASDQVKIEQIRQLLSRVSLRPYSATMQVVIIDGVERLTDEAANSLLKALEEPPTQSRFLLLTAHLVQCLLTIVSRCQVIRCQPLRAEWVRRILIEGQHCEARDAEAIARLSGGSASRAIELAARWAPYQEILARCASGASSAWIEQPLPETREEVTQFLDGMLGWVRDLVAAAAGDPERVAHAEYAEALRRQARTVDVGQCLEAADKLMALRKSLEQFVSPRLVGALAREYWLSLSTTSVHSRQSTVDCEIS